MRNKHASFTLKDAVHLFFKHPSPCLLSVISVCFWITRGVMETPMRWGELGVIVGVILYWPLQEWWMHRFLLHLPPLQFGRFEHELNFSRVHRLHHEDPKNIPLAFLPISVILSSLVFFVVVVYLWIGDWGYVCSFLGMAATSTLIYEWVHYLTHTDYKPRGSYYRKIWKLHRWHHYKHEGYWFSFTIPWIDSWMGTGPPVSEVPHSPSARTLREDTSSGDQSVREDRST